MGLAELFNEWIVERGSAKVQEKHIAFFRDQLAAADKKTVLLEKKITDLEAENEMLKSDLGLFQKENEILKNKMNGNVNPHNKPLDDVKVQILIRLSKEPIVAEIDIAQTLNATLPITKFHLEELKTASLLKRAIAGTAMRPTNGWALTQEGTRYLLENDIIT